MWDLPGPGLEPVSPALAGGFSTTLPPGKPLEEGFCNQTTPDRWARVSQEISIPGRKRNMCKGLVARGYSEFEVFRTAVI